MAKPIVASAVSDLPIVLEGCGRITPPGDARALRGALRELLKNPGEARALGERARARCLTEFAMDRVAGKLCDVVKTVLNDRRRPR
jgi:glycosyltransferase involved in cell wall biosynthesis